MNKQASFRSDIPSSFHCRAPFGSEHQCKSNKFGAIHISTPGGELGVKPGEYDVLEWVENPYYSQAEGDDDETSF